MLSITLDILSLSVCVTLRWFTRGPIVFMGVNIKKSHFAYIDLPNCFIYGGGLHTVGV